MDTDMDMDMARKKDDSSWMMKMMRMLFHELILLLFRSKICRVGTAHQCSRVGTGFSVGIAHPTRLIADS